MRKLFNMAKGWFIFLFYKRSEMARDRLAVCRDCELRKGVFCGVCGCELHAKAEIKEEHCPHPSGNNWEYMDAYNFILKNKTPGNHA